MGESVTEKKRINEIDDFDLIVYMNENQTAKRYHCGRNVTIGREAGDIVISSQIVSAIHGEISSRSGICLYKDTGADGTGSTNGSYVNGELIGKKFGKQDSRVLTYGSVIKINTAGDGYDARAVAIIVEEQSSEASFKRLNLDTSKKYKIGRGVGNSNKTISKKHAVLFYSNKNWYLEDLGSTNGTFVNNKRIQEKTVIGEMDVLRFSDCNFVFTGNSLIFYNDAISVDNNEITISNSLNVNIRECRVSDNSDFFKIITASHMTLLKNIRFSVKPGELTLILAGSGVGKSVLFEAMMGHIKVDGEVRYGKYDMRKSSKAKKLIGYVPQKDTLREHSTSYDTVYDAASFNMPARATKADIKDKVKKVLDAVELYEHSGKLLCKMSGGQAKRISIAVELLRDPEILFMDEPDSGLDPISSEKVMEIAHRNIEDGRSVVLITHNIEMKRIREYVDRVVILAKRSDIAPAEMAYTGSVQGALDFFNVDSLQDILELLSDKSEENGHVKAAKYIDEFERSRK